MFYPNKRLIYLVPVCLVLLAGGIFLFFESANAPTGTNLPQGQSPKEIAYEIEGESVSITGSVKYFGNEATGDLNSDGTPDTAFILTQDLGGSGTFYYVVVALKTADGYEGTNAIFLGDRIAPQTTEIRDGQVIVNYADRQPGEPMTASPSVGVSKYLAIQDLALVEVGKPLDFTQPITFKIGQSIVYPDGLDLTLKEINDSRCPADVQCIWQGELSALFVAQQGNFGNILGEVRLGTVNNTSLTVKSYLFKLVEADIDSVSLVVSQ